MPDDTPRFFGRRRGKGLRVTGRSLLEDLLPRLAIPQPGQDDRLDPASLFEPRPREVWLEIGFGGGEHLAAQAAAHPDVGLIGCEVFVNGVASLLGHVARLELSNVRLFAEDARRLLPALPDASIARAFLLFPDPWPKRRHEERRFVAPDNLDGISRLLVDGGEFRVASDDPTYQAWARRQMARRPDFEPIAPETWDRRPDDWAPTRYEQKAVDAGRKCTYMRYRRAPRSTLPRP